MTRWLGIMLVLIGFVVLAAPAHADEPPTHTIGPLTIHAPWARAVLPVAKASAAYMSIRNTGPADTLIAASTAAAARTELHQHINDGGIMRMRQIEGGIPIPAGATDLAPGGLHVMLMGLTRTLLDSDEFELTLKFAQAGTITVPVMVKPITAGMAH